MKEKSEGGKNHQTYLHSFYFTFNDRKGKKGANRSSCSDEKSTGKKKRKLLILNYFWRDIVDHCYRNMPILLVSQWCTWRAESSCTASVWLLLLGTARILCSVKWQCQKNTSALLKNKENNPEKCSVWDICLVYGTFTAREKAIIAWALNLQSFTGSGEGVGVRSW